MPRILFDGAGLDFSSSEGVSPNVLLEWLSIIPVFHYFNGLTVDLFSLN
mgnify:CR=1 FL=1